MACTVSGSWMAWRRSSQLATPIRSGNPPYQASGWTEIARSGRGAGWARKNQWYQRSANSALQRASASPIGTMSSTATAVVSHDREAGVAELAHQRDAVARHRPLRIGLVIVGRQRLRRFAVAAQIGADDR